MWFILINGKPTITIDYTYMTLRQSNRPDIKRLTESAVVILFVCSCLTRIFPQESLQ